MQEAKKYTVVEFTDENAVESIPSCWVDESRVRAYWPKYRTPSHFKTLVVEATLPDKKTWELCPIRIIKTTDSYQKAERLTSQAQETSTVESDESEPELPVKRKSKPAVRYSSSESESVDEGDESPGFKRPIPVETPKKKAASSVSGISGKSPSTPTASLVSHNGRSSASSRESSKGPVAPSTSRAPVAPLTPTELHVSSDSEKMFQHRVFKLLEKQNHDIRALTKEVEALKQLVQKRHPSSNEPNAISTAAASAGVEPFDLPLATEADVLQLEASIQDQLRFQALVNCVVTTGGDDYKRMVYCTMKRLFTKNIAILYSVYGRKGKKIFSHLRIYAAVIAAVRHRFADSTHEQVKARIGLFLAQSSDRDGGRKNRPTVPTRMNTADVAPAADGSSAADE